MDYLSELVSLLRQRQPALPEGLTAEQWAGALAQFAQSNSACWCADDRMDIDKLVQPALSLPGLEIPVAQLLYHLSPAETDRFWELFCGAVGRDVQAMQAERRERVLQAASAFAADMESVGVRWSAEQAAEFVANNRAQMATRLVGLLQPPLDIPKADHPYFWSHFEKVYNLLYPYTPAPKGVDLGFFETCISEADLEGCQPQDMIAKLMTPETMGKVMQLLQNPEGLQSLMGTFLPLLGSNASL
jgi:hypothetical protein